MPRNSRVNSRCLCLPVKAACILLNITSCAMYTYVLYFSPGSFILPFMGAELVVGAIGLIGAAVTFTCFSALYVIAQILMTDSVWFVGVNIILVIVNYDSWNQGSHSDYVNNLHIIANDKRWLLWLALILAVVGTFLVLVCIVGFTKLFYTPKKKRTEIIPTTQQNVQPEVPTPSVQQPITPSIIPQETPNVISNPQVENIYPVQYGLPQQGFTSQSPEQPIVFVQNFEPPPAYPGMPSATTINDTIEEKEGKYG